MRPEEIDRLADVYADILAAVFGLAATRHGHTRTPVARLHELICRLQREFPTVLPAFDLVGNRERGHSEVISTALYRLLSQRYDRPPTLEVTGDGCVEITVLRAETVLERLGAANELDARRIARIYPEVAARLVGLLRSPLPTAS